MIEGTRPYQKKNSAQNFAVPPSTETEGAAPLSPGKNPADAANLDRRQWFRSLVPALGNGLVEILRTGNHLRDELREIRSKKD
jgi:hypothetical protein